MKFLFIHQPLKTTSGNLLLSLFTRKNMKMKIAVTGGTGFIGSHLIRHFKAEGNEVLLIGRSMLELPAVEIAKAVSGSHVVINLAGEPVAGRWSQVKKEKILNSRIKTSHKLVEAINMLPDKPSVFLSASAIGIYNDEQPHDESSLNFGNDYLAEVCCLWENEASNVSLDVRKVIIRIGIVLGKNGGTLHKLLPLFRFGLGGRLGSGKQMMSWIHIDDLVKAIDFIIKSEISGVVNLTAPNPVSNKEFTKTLGKVIGVPVILSVPEFAIKLLFGEGAGVILQSIHVYPKTLTQKGFKFSYNQLEEALTEICKKNTVD